MQFATWHSSNESRSPVLAQCHAQGCDCQPVQLPFPRAFVPSQCPSITLCDLVSCLRNKGLSRINFVGDSTTFQIMGTLLCEASFEGRYGVQGWYLPADSRMLPPANATHAGIGYRINDWTVSVDTAVVGDRFDTVRVSAVSAYPTSCLGCQSGDTHSLLIALESAMANGLLNEPAAWVYNSGLWDMTVAPDSKAHSAPLGDSYERSVAAVLKALLKHSRGPIHLRDTNAVHSSLMPANVSAATRHKFAHYDFDGVKALNAAALRSVVSLQNGTGHQHHHRIQPFNYTFAATVDREDGHYPEGDIRHYGYEVNSQLAKLVLLRVCERL